MPTKPFVSIIIPAYNVQDYIAQTLESCLKQSFSDIEIIVVDDCGSDGSMAIAQSYARSDTRLKIVRNKENMKLFQTRGAGVRAASGQYVVFLDADGVLEPHAVGRCVEAMKSVESKQAKRVDSKNTIESSSVYSKGVSPSGVPDAQAPNGVLDSRESIVCSRSGASGDSLPASGSNLLKTNCDETIRGGAIETSASGVDMIVFNHKLWYSDHTREVRCYKHRYYPNIDMFYYYLINISGLCWNIWGKLIRRELYLRAFALIDTGSKINMAEDALAYFACTSLARSVLTLDEPLLLYRQREDSISRLHTPQQRAQSLQDHEIVSQTIASLSAELAPHASAMQRLYMRKYLSNALLSTQSARLTLENVPADEQSRQRARYHKRFIRAHRVRKALSHIVWLWARLKGAEHRI